MYSLVVYDRSRTRAGLLQDYASVQWQEHYCRPGEVKVSARLTEANLALLRPGNRIYNPDTGTAALILQAETLEDGAGQTLTARAVGTAWLLGQRVVMGCERVAEAESGIYGIYARNRRGLEIEPAAAVGPECPVEAEFTWGTVLEAVQTLAETAGLGFRVEFDPHTGGELLRVYRGVDRSAPGPGYVGYFGADMGNLANLRLTRGEADLRNVAIVGGEDTATGRTVRTVARQAVADAARRELFVDAKDLKRKAQVATPTGAVDEWGCPTYTYRQVTYTEAEYAALLDGRGLEKLAACGPTYEVRCDVEQGSLIYGRDYGLGDRMPVRLGADEQAIAAVVRTVKLVYEPAGRRVLVSLEGSA